MSRMIAVALLTLIVQNFLLASDVDKYPAGHRPFHTPKAPQPNGVLGGDTCFGYYATRWTPWNAACNSTVGSTTSVSHSCTTGAIILWDTPLSTMPAAPAVGTLVPAPESTRPMPPVNK